MIWRALDSPTVCARCHVEQPAGAQMAVYAVGPHIEHMRCAGCEHEVTVGISTLRRAKARDFNDRVRIEEAVVAKERAEILRPSRGFSQVATAYDALPADVRARHERAVGER